MELRQGRQKSAEIRAEVQLTHYDLTNMLVHLLRLPRLRSMVLEELPPALFEPVIEGFWKITWMAVSDLHRRYQSEVSRPMIQAEVNRLYALDPSLAPPDHVQLVLAPDTGLLDYAFRVPENELNENYARDLAQRFIYERAVLNPLRDCLLYGKENRKYAATLPNALDEAMRTSQRVHGLAASIFHETAPDWRNLRLVETPKLRTGLDFIDGPTGGQTIGDVNGFIGPIGAGKSTLLRQMAVKAAHQLWSISRETNTPPRVALFFTYEQPPSLFELTLWAQAARIPLSRLKQLEGDYSRLSTPETLLEYERAMEADAARINNPILCERERWDEMRSWLNTCLIIVDMSLSNGSQAGRGGIDEIVGTVEMILSRVGLKLGWIGIDYALRCIQRYMESRRISADQLRHHLGGFGDAIRYRLTDRYKAVGWVVSQVSGAASKRSPTARLSHLDSAEGSMFAENMSICGAMSPRCPITGCVQMTWSKIRYAPGLSPFRVLQIDPEFCRMEDVSTRYMAQDRQFVSVTDANRIQGPVQSRSQHQYFAPSNEDDLG